MDNNRSTIGTCLLNLSQDVAQYNFTLVRLLLSSILHLHCYNSLFQIRALETSIKESEFDSSFQKQVGGVIYFS